MKKQSVLNLIKYHCQRNDSAFRAEAMYIAKYFDSTGDTQLSEYIICLITGYNAWTPQ